MIRPTSVLLAVLLSFSLTPSPAAGEVLVVRGGLVHTLEGPAIENGVVVIEGGKITAVGAASEVTAPADARVLEAAVVTPGLVDARSTVGLSGVYNSSARDGGSRVLDQDQLETSAPMQPELRAIDAYDAREQLVEWVRQHGVTTVHTGHGPGALISGQTLIAKTVGDTVEEAVVQPEAMVAFTLGDPVSRNFDSPGTRAKGVAMLRERLLAAQRYAEKRARAEQAPAEDRKKKDGEEKAPEKPDRDLGLETLARVLDGELPALVTANEAPEILSALRLAREFGFRLILDGAAEAYLVIDEIREAGVPVIVHPTMIRPGGDTRNFTFQNLQRLREAGILAVLQTGHENYVPKVRVLLFEAGMAVAYGLPPEEALAAITLDAARVLGIDDRVGSLASGKEADLVLYDGDPFEYTRHVCTVILGGRVVSDVCR